MKLEPGTDAAALAGLIVADGRGHYFAIALADLERFRVPDEWRAALDAFTSGAEPEWHPADVAGFGDSDVWDGTRVLLERLLEEGLAQPPAARRFAAWAVLD